MRRTPLALVLLAASSASAVMVFPDAEPQLAHDHDQQVLSPSDSPSFVAEDEASSLADILTVTKATSLFYDYVRSVSHVNERTMVGLQKTTFFAPWNPTIIHLARKPHQGPSPPAPIDVVKSEEDQEKENFAYLDRWVSSHAVEDSISPKELRNGTVEGKKWKNMDGREIKIECGEELEGRQPWRGCKIEGNNIIDDFEASNGYLYIIDGTIPVGSD